MKLEGLIPFINVRYVAVDYGKGRLFLDCRDKRQRERLYRFACWIVTGIQASVKQFHRDLWPVLILTIEP